MWPQSLTTVSNIGTVRDVVQNAPLTAVEFFSIMHRAKSQLMWLVSSILNDAIVLWNSSPSAIEPGWESLYIFRVTWTFIKTPWSSCLHRQIISYTHIRLMKTMKSPSTYCFPDTDRLMRLARASSPCHATNWSSVPCERSEQGSEKTINILTNPSLRFVSCTISHDVILAEYLPNTSSWSVPLWRALGKRRLDDRSPNYKMRVPRRVPSYAQPVTVW